MLLFFILLTLLLSAFFSGSEIAYISANRLGIEVLKNKGNKQGKIIAKLYESPRDFLGTMLVGNNISLVIFTILMTSLLEPGLKAILGSDPFVLSLVITLVITLVVLIFGEFLPKTFFRLYSNEMLYRLSYPLSFFKSLLLIPSWLMTSTTNAIMKYVFKLPADNVEETLSRVDLEHYINDNISEEEDIDKAILTNALNLGSLKVRDCMIPRTEIVWIDKMSSLDEAIATFKESKLSRLVVAEQDIDNVIGYIHHQQLLKNPKSIKSLPMEISFVPETMNAQDLLMQFIREGNNMACVVNEYGGTAGLITLEDILEEIFGEIEDEHDAEDHVEKQIGEDEFLFSGRLEIDYINDKYSVIDLPDGDYHTLSGYLVTQSGEIPQQGDTLEYDGYRFIIDKVSNTKIDLIRVKRLESNPEE